MGDTHHTSGVACSDDLAMACGCADACTVVEHQLSIGSSILSLRVHKVCVRGVARCRAQGAIKVVHGSEVRSVTARQQATGLGGQELAATNNGRGGDGGSASAEDTGQAEVE